MADSSDGNVAAHAGPETLPHHPIPWWTWVSPLLGLVLLVIAFAKLTSSGLFMVALGAALVAAVFASVHHAEVVAHRVGEPFGTLVLAVAVTVIEVALVVSLMLGGGADKLTLARDTAFSAVMIVCNGVVGLSLLLGGVRHREQAFRLQGASGALAVLAALTVLTLVLPNYTTSAPGPVFTRAQLVFAAVVSLLLYGSFVFVQTVRHRDDFLAGDDAEHDGPMPTARLAAISLALLMAALVAVVGLAKSLATSIEDAVAAAGAPKAVVGVIIALLVLLPEGLASLRAASLNRLQTSLNLALGSALASVGLTIPAVAVVSISFNLPLTLGLDGKDQVLLFLTIVVGVLTLGTGRTTILQGIVHLVIAAAFLFLAVVP